MNSLNECINPHSVEFFSSKTKEKHFEQLASVLHSRAVDVEDINYLLSGVNSCM